MVIAVRFMIAHTWLGGAGDNGPEVKQHAMGPSEATPRTHRGTFLTAALCSVIDNPEQPGKSRVRWSGRG